MQETERYEFLKSFCAGGQGWDYFGETGVWYEIFTTRSRSKQAAREIAGRATVRLCLASSLGFG